jgi:hypothetical protein
VFVRCVGATGFWAIQKRTWISARPTLREGLKFAGVKRPALLQSKPVRILPRQTSALLPPAAVTANAGDVTVTGYVTRWGNPYPRRRVNVLTDRECAVRLRN